jgi:hypothetical protein
MSLACSSCGATDVPIDLDVKATPPEYVCRRCAKKSKCPECRRRVNRLISLPGGRSRCERCQGRIDKAIRAELRRDSVSGWSPDDEGIA